MKRFRLFLIGVAALILVLGVALAVIFSTWFQTWAVRRAVAGTPGMTITLGGVSAGMGGVAVRDVRVERDGAVLTISTAHADLPILAAVLHEKVRISQFVARGWVLDLTKGNRVAPPATVGQAVSGGPAAPPEASVGPGSAALALASVGSVIPGGDATGFHGVFGRLQLPVDFALHGVDVAGEVILPASLGRVELAITGGGLESGREGRFKLAGDAALADQAVGALAVRGTATASMDSPRTLSKVAAKVTMRASGEKFPDGVTLTAELSAANEAGNESYSAALIGEDRPLLTIEAGFPRDAKRLAGSWQLDLRDADLAPFMLGRELPEFAARGSGGLDADALFHALHASGQIDTTASGLGVLEPSLGDIGVVNIATEFDVMRSGAAFAIKRLVAEVAGERPILKLQALQAFEFNAATGDLLPADPAGELLDIVMHGVPLAWIRPHLPGVVITGDDLRGEFVATPRAGGVALRSRTPLTVTGLGVGQEGEPWLAGVDLTLGASADYTPHGWQAGIDGLVLARDAVKLVTVDARVGKLAGAEQPIKATGRLVADLPGVLAQPVGAETIALTGGEAEIDFVANLAATKEFQVAVKLRKLATGAIPGGEDLPSISAEVRADLAPGGQLVLNIPILIERRDRKSDLTLAGTMTPGKQVRTIAAQITSELLVVEDAKLLLGVVPGGRATPAGEEKPAAAPWEGYAGTVALELRKVVYTDAFHVSNVAGLLRLEGGTLKLDGMRAGLGETGDARVNAAISFDAGASEPYGMDAEVALTDFDPGPLFLALVPDQPPTVEGKFNVASKLSGRGESLGELAFGAGGDFQLISRGGVFRGLPVNVGGMVDNAGRLAGWIASAGSALGNLTGRRDYTEIANRTAAVAEFAKALNAIPYDQLNVVLTRDAGLNTTLKDFTLISPELRLTGAGRMTRGSGESLLDDQLAMEFVLKARGRQADLLKFLEAIEDKTDDLGYAAFTVPVRIGGTLGAPDVSDFSSKVMALALERSGLGTKASELLNRIRGGK
ncbi:MAG: AsmA family protein [Opitutus sp.]